MRHEEYWYWLCNLNGIGIKKINKLLDFFGEPEQVFHADKKHLYSIGLLNEKDKKEILETKSMERIQEEYGRLTERGIRFLNREEKDFPERLKHIYDAPVCLYLRGQLPVPGKTAIAIVGARNCSGYGREMALWFAGELSRAGIQVISGLALGIDGYAHWGAIKADRPTFGVMGCGIDLCYPASNIELYMKMQEQGGIISEYGMGTPARKGNFPMRNRLISGFSDGVLVVEAKEKSGSLITADMALEQGKDVFAIPGRICDSFSSGCNEWIRMGAELVSKPENILEHYHMIYRENHMRPEDMLPEDLREREVYQNIPLDPVHLNQIIKGTGLEFSEVIQLLGSLEKKKWIRQIMNNYYVRNFRNSL